MSECCHSAEMYEDGLHGAVLEERGADSLQDFISGLSSDPSLLDWMEPTVFASAERFI